MPRIIPLGLILAVFASPGAGALDPHDLKPLPRDIVTGMEWIETADMSNEATMEAALEALESWIINPHVDGYPIIRGSADKIGSLLANNPSSGVVELVIRLLSKKQRWS